MSEVERGRIVRGTNIAWIGSCGKPWSFTFWKTQQMKEDEDKEEEQGKNIEDVCGAYIR